jgi:hypothetical protein
MTQKVRCPENGLGVGQDELARDRQKKNPGFFAAL